jgi:TRAP-type mannitol/chloroaromatic compound transport system permease large subunit
LGFDPVLFGVLFTLDRQVGFLPPPFGPAAFPRKALAPPEIGSETSSRRWAVSLVMV